MDQLKVPLRALIVEDNASDAELLVHTLRRAGFEVLHEVVDTEPEFIARLTDDLDIVYCDYSMPRFDALRALELLTERHPNIPFIIVSGSIGEDIAVAAMRHGAWDYFLKDRLGRLGDATRHALDKRRLMEAARQTEAALRASEHRLRAILDSEPECVKIVAADGTLLDMNPAGLTMVEADAPEQVIGRPILDLIHPDDQEAFVSLHHATLRGSCSTLQFRVSGLHGALRWMETSSVPLREADGQINSVLSVTRDITERRAADERLHESEERFRQLAESIEDVFFLRNADLSEILYISPAFESVWGRSRQECYISPRSLLDTIVPEDRERAMERLAGASATGRYDLQYRIMRPDGSRRWIRSRGFPIHDEHGNLVRIAGIATDITPAKDAEEKIRRLNRVHAILSGINALIVRKRDRQELFDEACSIAVEKGEFAVAWIGLRNPDTGEDHPVAWAGEDAAQLATLKPASAAGVVASHQGIVARAMREAAPVFTNDLCAEPLDDAPRRREAVRREYRSFITLPLTVNGDVVGHFSLMARPRNFFNDEELKLLNELAGDISFALEYLEKAEQLDHLAYYDSLTGLPNRNLFHDRLVQAVARAERSGEKLALMFIDLDRFKEINDTLGHAAGDFLLKDAAQRVSGALRGIDTLARFGGDEFTLIQEGVADIGEIILLAQRLLDLFKEPFMLHGRECFITPSIGIAVYPTDERNADSLLKSADIAMYHAKQLGRNNFQFYQPHIHAKSSDQLQLETALRRALERREFTLHYQPQLEIATGRVVGAEALIRWHSRDLGAVPPARFIPLAEETGIIGQIGEWVLRTACQEAQKGRAAGMQSLRIAVNVSAHQLRQRDLVETVRAALDESGLPPECLELEITESVVMQHGSETIDILNRLRTLGVGLAIDDFGTGYSSLAYLKRFPVRKLKIDQSFVRNISSDPDDAAIVTAIISMAKSLKLKVTAEGVETLEQLAFLASLSCDDYQGYVTSKPLKFADFMEFARTWPDAS